jgi:Transposase DDE domain group 1
MAQLLSNFGADLTGPRQGASCAAREKAPPFLYPIRVCRHALVEEIAVELIQAEDEAERTGQPARRYKDFRWSTLDSWSRRRRVIAKAEWTGGEANPRFIVTSLKPSEVPARHLYEEVYCARGEMDICQA